MFETARLIFGRNPEISLFVFENVESGYNERQEKCQKGVNITPYSLADRIKFYLEMPSEIKQKRAETQTCCTEMEAI